MKYKYGVEYATGFDCPDLPGDVMVEAMYRDGVWHSGGADRLDEFNWARFSHFRIVDERYKPKTEDSSWFERGELPPVGVRCEMTHPGIFMHGWQKVTVETIFTDTDGCKRVVISNCNNAIWDELMPVIRVDSDLKFRPLKTERKKAIEAAIAVDGSITTLQVAALYDAGLLRLPEEK